VRTTRKTFTLRLFRYWLILLQSAIRSIDETARRINKLGQKTKLGTAARTFSLAIAVALPRKECYLRLHANAPSMRFEACIR